MELIFLGTSSGTPTKSRNVSAVGLKMQNSKSWYLIDCGEGTQHQILRTKLSLLHLRVICITHIHGDHCYGLPGLLASASMDGRKNKLTIIAPEGVKLFLESIINATQLELSFEVDYIKAEELTGILNLGDFDVGITDLSHRCPSYAYNFIEANIKPTLNKEKLLAEGIEPGPVWGKLQQGQDVILEEGRILKNDDFLEQTREPRSIVVCGDNDTPELLNDITPKSDVIVHEATYTQHVLNQVGTKPQHSSAKQVAEFGQQNQIKNMVLTHFSARYGYNEKKSPSINDVKDEALKFYSGNLFLANDFDVDHVDKQGLMSLSE
ncbi:MAG: ribonuclease Z [gamma proteobacterium symbiont of Taylorina sp.]|nr:ribonuclease Z [gamma proteobacterium symbiont of Taylorina sp.]